MLFITLILKIKDMVDINFKFMGKMHNDRNLICLTYYLVIHWIFREPQAKV